MCYHLIPEYLNPYDYERFDQYEGKAYSVVTNLVTGKPEYLRIRDMRTDIVKIRASASLPLVSRNVKIGDRIYLDGGMSDSIPIAKSIMDGNQKNVVVLTKEVGYVRKPAHHLGLVKARYWKYPKLYQLMRERHINYNDTLDYLDEQIDNGRAFVIRPQKVSGVGRTEKDGVKLRELYEEGYQDAKNCEEELMQYLES
jgi:predicted patatin/cPLA2 family phospholipase